MYSLLESGTQIKQYTLQEQLGRGSSGDVWKASNGSKIVAIKFMNEQLVQSHEAEKHLKRLTREIEALKRLKHPNIPALYDYDTEYWRPYLVMQYIDGEPFDRLIASGEIFGINLTRRLEIIAAIAGALATAHRSGIIHRDIKPANINGVAAPYLLDFSVSLPIEQLSSTQQFVGTGVYLPPHDLQVDALSDIYSFALVAYEILFGKHAIFTPATTGNTAIHTRVLAARRLENDAWRYPSRIPQNQLPRDILGADLRRLDAIFHKAFAPRESRYTNLTHFTQHLQTAILIPTNTPFLDQQPALPPAFTPRPGPAEDRFTAIEANNAQDTDLGTAQQTLSFSLIKVGGVLLLLVLAAIALYLAGIV